MTPILHRDAVVGMVGSAAADNEAVLAILPVTVSRGVGQVV